MIDYLEELFLGILHIALNIGSGTFAIALFPLLLALAVLIGILLGGKISSHVKLIFLGLVFVGIFIWSMLFVVTYEQANDQHVVVVTGWNYTVGAQSHLERNPHLLDLDRSARATQLLAHFSANPQRVWLGYQVEFARWAGALLVCLVVMLIFALIRIPGLFRRS